MLLLSLSRNWVNQSSGFIKLTIRCARVRVSKGAFEGCVKVDFIRKPILMQERSSLF